MKGCRFITHHSLLLVTALTLIINAEATPDSCSFTQMSINRQLNGRIWGGSTESVVGLLISLFLQMTNKALIHCKAITKQLYKRVGGNTNRTRVLTVSVFVSVCGCVGGWVVRARAQDRSDTYVSTVKP